MPRRKPDDPLGELDPVDLAAIGWVDDETIEGILGADEKQEDELRRRYLADTDFREAVNRRSWSSFYDLPMVPFIVNRHRPLVRNRHAEGIFLRYADDPGCVEAYLTWLADQPERSEP